MASLGSVLKTVGRGAMKGVLGFDDRDVRSKFARRGKDTIGKVEQADRDYGFANLNPALRTAEVDGVEELPEDPELAAAVAADEPSEPVENFGMSELKIGYGESAPGLDFGEGGFTRGDPTGKTGMEMAGPRKMAPGLNSRPKVGSTQVGMPSVAPGLPDVAPPGLIETGQGYFPPKPELKVPGLRSMRGSISDDVDSMEGFIGSTPTSRQRDFSGGMTFEGRPTEDAFAEAEGFREGTKDYAIGQATGAGIGMLGKGLRAIPGLTAGTGEKIKKGVDWFNNANSRRERLDIKGSYFDPLGKRVPMTGKPPATPSAGPGKSTIDQMLAQARSRNAAGGKYFEPGGGPGTQYAQELMPGGGSAPAGLYPVGPGGRPMPGAPGMAGPFEKLPPGLRETNIEVLYSPGTKSLKRVAR